MISMLRMKKMNRSSETPHGHLLTPREQAVLFIAKRSVNFTNNLLSKIFFLHPTLKVKILPYIF